MVLALLMPQYELCPPMVPLHAGYSSREDPRAGLNTNTDPNAPASGACCLCGYDFPSVAGPSEMYWVYAVVMLWLYRPY